MPFFKNIEKKEKIKLAFLGAATGFVNGLFGSGGGMLLVPLLPSTTKMEEKQAFSNSVGIVFFLSIVSATVYLFKNEILFSELWPLLLGGVVGGMIGAKFLSKIKITFLRKIFAFFILYAAWKAVMGG